MENLDHIPKYQGVTIDNTIVEGDLQINRAIGKTYLVLFQHNAFVPVEVDPSTLKIKIKDSWVLLENL